MKRILSTAALSLSFLATTAAIAGEGYVTTDVSLRAGPDSGYPDVAMLYAGTTVAIEGCVDGWSWCDVATGDSRGWVPANYLQHEYQGQRVLVPEYGVRIGIPVVSFVFGSYWDNYYSHRSWYGERERWSQVRPEYLTLGVNHDSYRHSHDASYGTARGDSRALRTRNQRTVVESRQSGVVTTPPSYRGGRPANTAAPQRSGTTEVRSSGRYANRARPVEQRTVESTAVVQQRSRTTEVRSQQTHASHAQQVEHNTAQSKAMAEHKAARPRVIAERKVEPKASRKENPAKSRPDHQGGKDIEQH